MMTMVQWDALGHAFDALTLYKKIRVLKFQHNWIPIAARLGKLYPGESCICPNCEQKVEMWEHMYQCEHDTDCSSQLHMIRKLKSGLRKIKTNGLILKVL
eukprot:14686263-Ditylum_brightwellii.AAC.1